MVLSLIMQSPKQHTVSLFRIAAVLCGLFVFSIFPTDTASTDFSFSKFAESGNHFNSASDSKEDSSSKNRAASGSMSEVTLKESPEQEQIRVASHNPSVLKQGSNPPEPDSKDVSEERSNLNKALTLLPKEYQSDRIFRLSLHLLSHFLYLPGDIAINAP